MAKTYDTLSALFTDIADAIREKTGETASIVADDFPDVIRERLQTAVTLINFTIDGTSYQAEEGMTVSDWINSSYNTAGLTVGNLAGLADYIIHDGDALSSSGGSSN